LHQLHHQSRHERDAVDLLGTEVTGSAWRRNEKEGQKRREKEKKKEKEKRREGTQRI